MEDDLFINLFKYKASENIKPVENFSTELFSFILKYTKEKYPLIFKIFLDALKFRLRKILRFQLGEIPKTGYYNFNKRKI